MTQAAERTTHGTETASEAEGPAPDRDEAREDAEEPAEASVEGHVCTVAFCPIGLALSAAERVQPDVVSHLLVAGREFFLAAKAVMDARADDLTGEASREGSPRMEHIDIG